ncbi:uncharacterized protein LOC132394519 isoform X3 [Hypanus sabinus]|uniref:uncharacterized protein LOC132394519 isoform X3 n=1 Tax=Hypanus sabinus TaxID=79690 RepID=UPI0028C3D5D8|nr:uncharacterized protein LOC132394519 isoform X3 [Hypanus sabinus]
MLLLLLQFVLVVVNAEDKGKQKVGVLGSSVLLDPELKVDPSKSEKVWTFNGRSILLHVPGHSSVEPSDQFKFRLHFNTSNGALTVNGAERGDQGNYTFIVGGQELRIIQLRLFDKLSKASISTNIKSLGFTVELTCDVFGDPYVYQWQKNGGEISQRHQLTDGNRTLVISGSSCEDRGVYTCITTNPASSIQTNYTLMLRGFSLNGVILIAVLTAGQVISAASLQSAVLPDQRRWKTLGGCLGYRFYFLILWICNTLSLIAMYIVFVYWSVVGGISQLDLVVICVMIIGLQLSSLYINALPYVSKIWELLEGSHTFRILSRNISVFYTILKDCVIVAWIINITSFGLPTVGIVSFVLSFVLPIAFILIPECLVLKKELDKDRVKEEVGLVGSSVLLDPELKVDPSKSEIVWTFNGRSILHHVPGRSLVELSDQFKFRLHFDTANAALTVNGAEHGDQGVYTFIVDGQELRIIQLRLFGDSIKDVLIDGLWTVLLIFPVIGVICLSHLIWKYPQKVFLFLGGYLNLIFLLGISVSNLTPGFYSKDTVTIAVSITMVVLLVVVFISLLILWWKARRYYNGDRFQRQISVYNVGFLLVIVIATISWMVFKGLRPEDVGVVITLMVGLVFPAAYAIIFMCWSRKEYPDDKRWWWCLNICNIVALVFILIAFICWIVSEDQSCKTNIPIWILLALFGVTVVIALSRFFPVCSRNKGTNENNRADKKQDCGEVQELQTLSPGHEAEPENHAVC